MIGCGGRWLSVLEGDGVYRGVVRCGGVWWSVLGGVR